MKRIAIILTAVLALLAASPALAADLCINSAVLGLVVGKGFTLPSKNKCKPFVGFGFGGMAAGTGCRTADGSLFRLHYTLHKADQDVTESVACNFHIPLSMGGGCRVRSILDVNAGHAIIDLVDSATAGPCTAGQANVP